MIYISAETAELINKSMINTYSKGEFVGVKEPALLDSAINRPLATMFGKSLYDDIFEKQSLFLNLSHFIMLINGRHLPP